MARTIWHNGEIKPESEAKISIYDMAMMYSYPFEMTRTFNKKHFKLREHLYRLFRSMKYLSMKTEYDVEQLVKVCNDLVDFNTFRPEDEHRLIINAYGGGLSIYKDVSGVIQGTHIMITDIPLRWTVKGMDKLFDTGINAIIPNQKVIPSYILDNRMKNHCRLHFLRANMEISECPGDNNWPLLTDENGFVAEFPGANFFIVKGGCLFTPKPINILEGISREYIMNQLCPHLFLDCKEVDILPYDILTADEAFCSATPFCIIPITKINSQEIGSGKMGNITSKLIKLWSSNVGVDIIEQIKKYNEDVEIEDGFTSPYTFNRK